MPVQSNNKATKKAFPSLLLPCTYQVRCHTHSPLSLHREGEVGGLERWKFQATSTNGIASGF